MLSGSPASCLQFGPDGQAVAQRPAAIVDGQVLDTRIRREQLPILARSDQENRRHPESGAWPHPESRW